jgi:hypothetical protein
MSLTTRSLAPRPYACPSSFDEVRSSLDSQIPRANRDKPAFPRFAFGVGAGVRGGVKSQSDDSGKSIGGLSRARVVAATPKPHVPKPAYCELDL